MTKQNPVQKIGVIGLGLMGTAITVRLIENGFVPVVWNRTRLQSRCTDRCGSRSGATGHSLSANA
ncbi:MAG: NAD(P)-binding domain-containing protein [Pirellulaceae bacterium]